MNTDAAVNWFKKAKKGVGDLRPLWTAVEPQVRKFAKHEFDGSNPNLWMELKPSYREIKVKQGYPATIGVRTGKMRDAASKDALVKIKRSLMSYRLNNSVAVDTSGVNYAKYFDKARKIYRFSQKRVVSFINGTSLKYINAMLGKIKGK